MTIPASPSPAPAISWEQAVQWLRGQPDQAELVRACYFDDPLAAAAARYHAGAEWQGVRQLLQGRSGLALDMGAGRGISSFALARDGWTVTALEPDASDLVGAGAIRALAGESGLPISVVEAYSSAIPVAAASFDLVYARQALHHCPDLSATLREVSRVLRPGGLFIATREHVISRPGDLDAFLRSHPLHHLYGGENAYGLAEYTGAIERAGLTLRQVLPPLGCPINYFPLAESDRVRVLARPLARIFGQRLAQRLLDPDQTPGRVLLPLAVRLFTALDNSPGRLYSFVAEKPGEAA